MATASAQLSALSRLTLIRFGIRTAGARQWSAQTSTTGDATSRCGWIVATASKLVLALGIGLAFRVNQTLVPPPRGLRSAAKVYFAHFEWRFGISQEVLQGNTA